jgi:hypothetical protein
LLLKYNLVSSARLIDSEMGGVRCGVNVKKSGSAARDRLRESAKLVADQIQGGQVLQL